MGEALQRFTTRFDTSLRVESRTERLAACHGARTLNP